MCILQAYVSAWQVIITITGGSTNCNWPSTSKDMFMKGIMDTRALKPIFITTGSDSGFIKYVGEARAKFNPNVVKTPAHFQNRTELASLNVPIGKILVL
jgi:hypothetical protein